MTENKKSPEEVLEQLEFLFKRYSDEMRAMTQPYLLQRVRDRFPDYDYKPDDVVVRESLMEHVGSLPVVAIELYPYINDDEVDLGKALTMIAMHDIGELITHDEMTFTKSESGKKPEQDAALSLLDPSYHDLYKDVESQTSKSAKFAKAVDKITPDLFELFSPADITIKRYGHFLGPLDVEEIVNTIKAKKQPYMQWNPFMLELHRLVIANLRQKLLEATKKLQGRF